MNIYLAGFAHLIFDLVVCILINNVFGVSGVKIRNDETSLSPYQDVLYSPAPNLNEGGQGVFVDYKTILGIDRDSIYDMEKSINYELSTCANMVKIPGGFAANAMKEAAVNKYVNNCKGGRCLDFDHIIVKADWRGVQIHFFDPVQLKVLMYLKRKCKIDNSYKQRFLKFIKKKQEFDRITLVLTNKFIDMMNRSNKYSPYESAFVLYANFSIMNFIDYPYKHKLGYMYLIKRVMHFSKAENRNALNRFIGKNLLFFLNKLLVTEVTKEMNFNSQHGFKDVIWRCLDHLNGDERYKRFTKIYGFHATRLFYLESRKFIMGIVERGFVKELVHKVGETRFGKIVKDIHQRHMRMYPTVWEWLKLKYGQAKNVVTGNGEQKEAM